MAALLEKAITAATQAKTADFTGTLLSLTGLKQCEDILTVININQCCRFHEFF
jgi:hypothetical protein